MFHGVYINIHLHNSTLLRKLPSELRNVSGEKLQGVDPDQMPDPASAASDLYLHVCLCKKQVAKRATIAHLSPMCQGQGPGELCAATSDLANQTGIETSSPKGINCSPESHQIKSLKYFE